MQEVIPLPFPDNRLIYRSRRRIEIVSAGVDESLQGLAGDPFGGISWVGLRVPPLVTTGPENRYLFLLCSFNIGDNQRARVIGFRQAWTLGFRQQPLTQGGAPRVVEQQVEDPFFKLPDANISWHLQIMSQQEPYVPNPSQVFDPAAGGPARNLAFEISDTPALLFQTVALASPFYVSLTAYTPPNDGRPWGRPLAPEFGTFYDLKARWRDAADWYSLELPVEGPARVCFFASVQQTDPSRRVPLTTPTSFFPCGLSCEEQFLKNFPNAIIWRVAGALIVELDDDRP